MLAAITHGKETGRSRIIPSTVIDRVPKFGYVAAYAKQAMRDKLSPRAKPTKVVSAGLCGLTCRPETKSPKRAHGSVNTIMEPVSGFEPPTVSL